MDKLFEKLMEKKKGQPLDENYKNAKMSMLEALQEEMHKMMGNDLKNQSMKKVEVAAPDQSGLKEGLDKAKDMLGSGDAQKEDDSLDQDGDNDHEESIADHADKIDGSVADETDVDHDPLDDSSSDELDEMIKHLEMKKQMALAKGK